MTEDRDAEAMCQRLRTALPPWTDDELHTDLWPRMLRRLDEQPAAFGWFEALVAAATLVSCVFFPELVPMMLYHL